MAESHQESENNEQNIAKVIPEVSQIIDNINKYMITIGKNNWKQSDTIYQSSYSHGSEVDEVSNETQRCVQSVHQIFPHNFTYIIPLVRMCR